MRENKINTDLKPTIFQLYFLCLCVGMIKILQYSISTKVFMYDLSSQKY